MAITPKQDVIMALAVTRANLVDRAAASVEAVQEFGPGSDLPYAQHYLDVDRFLGKAIDFVDSLPETDDAT